MILRIASNSYAQKERGGEGNIEKYEVMWMMLRDMIRHSQKDVAPHEKGFKRRTKLGTRSLGIIAMFGLQR